MITRSTIQTFLLAVIEQLDRMDTQKSPINLTALENIITLTRLYHLLHSPPPDFYSRLQEIFSMRWYTIMHTNLEYLHDFTNPVNNLCTQIAKTISKEIGQHYFNILMPTLNNPPHETYLISDYRDPELKPWEFVLSESSHYTIHIPATISAAQTDGILKHNILLKGKVCKLKNIEHQKVLSRHPKAQSTYDKLNSRLLFKIHGNTVGAHVYRLAEALQEGGVDASGEEFNASHHANTAIVEFNQYLSTLSKDVKNQLMQAKWLDDYSKEPTTFSYVWQKLTEPNKLHYKDGELHVQYCIHTLSKHIFSILESTPNLYNLVSDQIDTIEKFSRLEKEAREALAEIEQGLPQIHYHPFYENSDRTLFMNVLKDLRWEKITWVELKWLNFIIKEYKTNYLNDNEIKHCLKIFLKNIEKNSKQDAFCTIKNAISFEHNEVFNSLIKEPVHSGFFNPHGKRNRNSEDEIPGPEQTRRLN